MGFFDFLRGKEKKVFLYVQDGVYGLETFFNPAIRMVSPAYRLQLVSFLEGVVKELGGGDSEGKRRKRS